MSAPPSSASEQVTASSGIGSLRLGRGVGTVHLSAIVKHARRRLSPARPLQRSRHSRASEPEDYAERSAVRVRDHTATSSAGGRGAPIKRNRPHGRLAAMPLKATARPQISMHWRGAQEAR
jgi:hypothetical protein